MSDTARVIHSFAFDLKSAPVEMPVGDSGAPAARPPRPGDPCPKCGLGRLDYDGLLNLACPQCLYNLSGCFT